MLAWITRLFGSSANRTAEIQATADKVLPFLGSAKMQVDQRDLMTPNKHVLIYCFALGCVDAAAAQQGHRLDDTSKLTVLLHLMKATSQNTDAHDISAMHGRCMTLLGEEEGQRARVTGEDCFRRWQTGEKQVAGVLGKYLASLKESPAIPDGL